MVRGTGDEKERGQGQPAAGQPAAQGRTRPTALGGDMKNTTTLAALALAVAGSAALAHAQASKRPAHEQVTAMIGGKKVTVDYGRPSLNGRTIDQLMSKLGP